MKLSYRLAPLVSCALLAFFISPANGQILLSKMISDHAVLQRGVPIRIWGKAAPGTALSVQFHAQNVPAIADRLGEWTAWLMPETAGGPYQLTVKGKDGVGVQASDLMVGDVWIASGQSNMQMPLNGFPPGATLKNAAAEIAAANRPQLRLLHVQNASSDYPLAELTGNAAWTLCTPQTAADFSAVAYFFGVNVARDEKVTIGLIDTTWGGTPADSWVSMDGLAANPVLLPAFAARAHFAEHLASQEAQIAAEKREDDEARAAGKPLPSHGWHAQENSWSPAGLYNGMISPLAPYSIKGFLWYQGETNSGSDRAPYYATLFPALIADWRSHFAQGDLPFLYVQISSFNSPGENWGMIRDAQRRTLSVRNTAMAVSLDVGNPDNVHPADKQTVGMRLALAAEGLVYGKPAEFYSPLFREATTEANGMRVWFDHAEGLSSHGKPVEGFELAGENRKFFAAKAVILGDTVLVDTPAVREPRYVRYAWTNVAPPSLYNSAGLPASTFDSEPSPLN